MLKHASLFSGIGGFDMAASWMGWQNIFNCEKDPFCRRILKYYWPEAEQYEDIYQFNALSFRGTIDIISGGFPCQPFSHAGRRKGKEDDRYLWPETRRIITEVNPEWIVLENVAGLFTILEPESLSEMEVKAIELFCSDSEQEANATILRLQRRVIGSIISEIRSAGYLLPQMADGTPVVLCVPACAVNAPHRRDRTWFIAHADRGTDQFGQHRSAIPGRDRVSQESGQAAPGLFTGYADQDRFRQGLDRNPGTGERPAGSYAEKISGIRPGPSATADQSGGPTSNTGNGGRSGSGGKPAWFDQIPAWDAWPTQPAVCGRNDGLSRELDGTTFSKWREASVKAFGNAIVPQVALEMFRSIEAVNANGVFSP